MSMFDGSCWLCPGEQEEAIGLMLEGGLLKWDNERGLPLKSGGKTDIYVNLRMMRNEPAIMKEIAFLYENPLRRLRVKRFVEVPEAVSPLAGAISVATGIPVVTIRGEAKEGRVVSGKRIGDLSPREVVAIIDDVITNGASKVPALTVLRSAFAKIAGMVVMVDRQQGWREQLAKAGFGDIGVWPGMYLHDIRRFLISNGLMQRCSPEREEKNPIIVALDGRSWEEVLPLIDQLRTSGCIFKVNDLLFGKGIDSLIPDLSVYGRVMADLKSHDISNTVTNTCKRLCACPPWAVTVHATGGGEMVGAAKKVLEGLPTKVLAVTVLTSIDPKTCEEIYTRQPLEQVLKLAEIADEAGADGFVCSPEELPALRSRYSKKILVPAGIRSPGKGKQDQKRVGTPESVRKNGANNFVMGRQILGALDPVDEVYRVLGEELHINL